MLAILAGKLPEEKRNKERIIVLGFAMVLKVLLLLSLFLITKITKLLFGVLNFTISGRDLVLITGGIFLIIKSTLEIHSTIQPEEKKDKSFKKIKWKKILFINNFRNCNFKYCIFFGFSYNGC